MPHGQHRAHRPIPRRPCGSFREAHPLQHWLPTNCSVGGDSFLRDIGESLAAGTAGLTIVGVSDMQAKIDRATARADRIEKKQIEADVADAQKDAEDDS